MILNFQYLPKSLDGKVPAEYIGIVSWIRQNRDNLLAYWAQDIDSVELSERLL